MQNTLVSLPTGLGKTLIAAVVMYNYYRWFPTGKVVCKFLPCVDLYYVTNYWAGDILQLTQIPHSIIIGLVL